MKRYTLFSTLWMSIFLLSASMVMAQYQTPERSGGDKPFPWPEGKRCAVSLTFDDARLSQIDAGIPLLNQYNIKATFYISPRSFLRRIEGWKAAAAAGHEIGNHTMSHPCTGNYAFSRDNALEDYDLDRIAKEMDDANRLIFERLQIPAVSFAYPCGQKFVGRGENLKSYIPLVSQKFMTGRGWLDESANDPWFCDFSQLLGMESDGKSFDELKKRVDNAAKERRWLILAGHEMGSGGNQTTLLSSLKKLFQYAQDPANGVWIDTVASVAEYIQTVRAGASR
ncbi:MAG: polysaccharide deacetylase family protein [Candidatus Omnitrophica bacterium]|nr:polysaccharide deacetylase family protein [Candidatus Omnitrophota bacterium]